MKYRPLPYRWIMRQLTTALDKISAWSDRAADACFWEARDPGVK